jgi:hypothetical protein
MSLESPELTEGVYIPPSPDLSKATRDLERSCSVVIRTPLVWGEILAAFKDVAIQPIGVTKWGNQTWRVLYTSAEIAQRVLDGKEIKNAKYTLIPLPLKRLKKYTIKTWWMMQGEKEIKEAVESTGVKVETIYEVTSCGLKTGTWRVLTKGTIPAEFTWQGEEYIANKTRPPKRASTQTEQVYKPIVKVSMNTDTSTRRSPSCNTDTTYAEVVKATMNAPS